MNTKNNKGKARKSNQNKQVQNDFENIKFEFDVGLVIEVSFLLPGEDTGGKIEAAGKLLHVLYNKAPFLLSWSGPELIGCLKYIQSNYPFTDVEIIKVLTRLDGKKRKYRAQEMGSSVSDNRLGYRRSIPRAENHNGSPIIYISLHE